MNPYIGFIPLDNITDEALDTIANYIRNHKGIIVCHYQNVPVISRLYERLGREYPDYICIHNDKELSYQRIVESCDTLLIYWDGKNGRSQEAVGLKNKPEQTFMVLPSGYMVPLNENYVEQANRDLNPWLTRPVEQEPVIKIKGVEVPEWDGTFSSEYFFLSALSTLETPYDGFVYPSLMHALTAQAIREQGYRKFFQSTRILYGADIVDWIKDFNIDVEDSIVTSPTIIAELIYNRVEHNKQFFREHPFDINKIVLNQSYPTDIIIASLIKGVELEDELMVNTETSIRYTLGDMFDNDDNGILFIPVNCKGSMGAGLALDAAERYPDIEKVYKSACKDKSLDIGKPVLVQSKSGQYLLLFPTKNDWRKKSEIEYIDQGIQYFYQNIVQSNQNLPLHIPMLGCGLGGLNWKDVQPIIEKYFTDYGSSVYVYIQDAQKEV